MLNNINKHRNIIKVVIFFSIALLIAFGIAFWLRKYSQNTKASFDGIRLLCSPRSTNASVGQELTLTMTINTNTKLVSAVDMDLEYNPKHIKVISFSPGKVFPVTLYSDLTSNRVRSVIGVNPESPFSGSGILGQLKVKILTVDETEIRFSSNTKVAELESEKNELSSTVPCKLN